MHKHIISVGTSKRITYLIRIHAFLFAGVPSMTKNGKRACLSLGAIAKSLHETNITESDRIVERLEIWLEHHNQSKQQPFISICTIFVA